MPTSINEILDELEDADVSSTITLDTPKAPITNAGPCWKGGCSASNRWKVFYSKKGIPTKTW